MPLQDTNYNVTERCIMRTIVSKQIQIIKIILLILLASAISNSCNNWTTAKAKISTTQLSYPDANYASLVRANGELIAFVANWGTKIQLQYAMQGDQALRHLQLPEDNLRCLSQTDTDYYMYTSFPDGRLQLWEDCRGGTKNQPGKTITNLLAYDWQTGGIEEIASLLPLGSSDSTWNPDMTHGVVYLDSKFASRTLYWVWKDGFGPLDVVVGEQNHSWNLENDFPDFAGANEGTTGNVGRVAWSPNGHSIALFASPDAIGKTGSSRFYVEYKLYIMNAEGKNPIAVLDQVYFPFLLKWSPDSKFIAFIGRQGYFKEEGIWLYSIERKSAIEVAKGKFKDILWSIDGKNITAIQCEDDLNCSNIEDLDIGTIVH